LGRIDSTTSEEKAMKTHAITIQVDPETADAYRAASPDERDKIDTLLALKLREAVRAQGSRYRIEPVRGKPRRIDLDNIEAVLAEVEGDTRR
jgi:hypothetical protein